jgi:hypothetical protein
MLTCALKTHDKKINIKIMFWKFVFFTFDD